MNILVINCGSSSFKYQLLEMKTEALLCSGLVERIGQDKGALTHKKNLAGGETEKYQLEERFQDHTVALKAVLNLLVDSKWGVIKSIQEIDAVGHRVVQGGELLQKACVVGESEKETIRRLFSLAPLHNPANLQGIEVAQSLCPHAPSVAVFDTEFHSTMPPHAFRYAIPGSYYTESGIRRYGFHGTSHRYVSRKAAEFLNKPVEEINLITCHLGNGSSIAAVRGGKSIDTSMGFTPLAGVVMGTRCGDIDPAIPVFLSKNKGMSADEVDNLMNKQSGLFGLCGMSDMRDLHAAVEAGNKDARLALDMFCYSIKRTIGAYWAVLGKVDGIVFTAGIGENDNIARAQILEGMEQFGIIIDKAVNDTRSGEARLISTSAAKVPVMVIPTNEELEIARTTMQVLQESK